MGKLFTLTDDIRNLARDAIDDLLEAFGKTCRLIYPEEWVPCTLCGPVGEAGVSWGGATVPGRSVCEGCGGDGLKAVNRTDDITMRIAWHPHHFWLKPAHNIQVPAGVIQTKCFASDLPKILKSRRMVAETEMEPFTRYTFELDGEPVDVSSIVKARYAVCWWKRD